MTILAVCPYCKTGKVRAPRDAVGASATCPRCFNSFTVVDAATLRGTPAKKKSRTPPAEVLVANKLVDPVETTELEEPEAPEPEVKLPPILTPLPPPPKHRERDPESAFVMAMVAFVLAGVGFAVTYLPYGRLIALVPTLAGIVFAFFGLVVADKRRLWPFLALGLHLFIIVMVAAFPSWIGLGQWVPARTQVSDGPRLVPFDGKAGYEVDEAWLDAAKGGWQRGDVRVTVTSTWVNKVAAVGPKKVQTMTKEPYLVINLHVRNFGGGRVIEYRSWTNDAPPEQAGARLVDSTGKELKRAQLEEGWQLRDRPALAAQLFPSQGIDDQLVFEAPEKGAGYVRLELPAWAFGESGEPVRFQIALGPPSMPAPPGGNSGR